MRAQDCGKRSPSVYTRRRSSYFCNKVLITKRRKAEVFIVLGNAAYQEMQWSFEISKRVVFIFGENFLREYRMWVWRPFQHPWLHKEVYLAIQSPGYVLMLTKLPKSDSLRHFTANANHLTKDILRHNGIPATYGSQPNREYLISLRSSFQIMETHGESTINICFARSFASKASKKLNQSETKKDVSTVEDPFDAPTYNIPEKPVTFTEGASYSILILAGLGVAAAAAYAVFKELIFEPKEYKIFNKALKRIQDDSQVRVRIGSPITGYGQESRNRAARQRIPNRIFTDEDGLEHVQINFYIRGPHGAGKVSAEMFKDKVDNQWKYTYPIVEIMQPSRSQLILESYMPAPAPVAT